MRSVRASDGSECVAAALFPADRHSDLTRRLMTCVMAFADDTGHFTGGAGGFGAITGLPVAGFLFALIAAGSGIGGTGWLRVGCVILVLMLLSVTSFVQALASGYRL